MSIISILGAAYVLVTILVWAFQDRLIFPVQPLPEDLLTEFAVDRGIVPVRIPTEDGLELYGWHNKGESDRAVILFHGNAATLAGAWPIHQELRSRGWDVLSFAYRGYPGSPGSPSERGIQQDARAVWKHATTALNYAPSRVVLHGRSLGGGAVGTIMTEVHPGAIVFQSTFRSVRAMAMSSYPFLPVRFLLKHPFDTEAKAPSVSTPALIVHSRADEVIPVAHGRVLASRFSSGEYFEVEALGHNEDLITLNDDARNAYFEFLEKHVPRTSSAAGR